MSDTGLTAAELLFIRFIDDMRCPTCNKKFHNVRDLTRHLVESQQTAAREQAHLDGLIAEVKRRCRELMSSVKLNPKTGDIQP